MSDSPSLSIASDPASETPVVNKGAIDIEDDACSSDSATLVSKNVVTAPAASAPVNAKPSKPSASADKPANPKPAALAPLASGAPQPSKEKKKGASAPSAVSKAPSSKDGASAVKEKKKNPPADAASGGKKPDKEDDGKDKKSSSWSNVPIDVDLIMKHGMNYYKIPRDRVLRRATKAMAVPHGEAMGRLCASEDVKLWTNANGWLGNNSNSEFPGLKSANITIVATTPDGDADPVYCFYVHVVVKGSDRGKHSDNVILRYIPPKVMENRMQHWQKKMNEGDEQVTARLQGLVKLKISKSPISPVASNWAVVKASEVKSLIVKWVSATKRAAADIAATAAAAAAAHKRTVAEERGGTSAAALESDDTEPTQGSAKRHKSGAEPMPAAGSYYGYGCEMVTISRKWFEELLRNRCA